ncbi:MAG: hypothetical protein H7A55_22555 [Verrucomicrobiaceae bacterium]|nr:hypothetical protein [Verrucomicrobiaceae bacterium]
MKTQLSADLQQTANHLKDEAINLGNSAIENARDRVVAPAVNAAANAGQYAQHVYEDAREAVTKQLSQAGGVARQQCDTAVKWAAANPLAAIGVAFVAGLFFAKSALTSR